MEPLLAAAETEETEGESFDIRPISSANCESIVCALTGLPNDDPFGGLMKLADSEGSNPGERLASNVEEETVAEDREPDEILPKEDEDPMAPLSPPEERNDDGPKGCVAYSSEPDILLPPCDELAASMSCEKASK